MRFLRREAGERDVRGSGGVCLHLDSSLSETTSKDVDPYLGLAKLLTRTPGFMSSKYKRVRVDGNLSGEASWLSELRASRLSAAGTLSLHLGYNDKL